MTFIARNPALKRSNPDKPEAKRKQLLSKNKK
jgi:hypothetical protein